MKKFTPASIAAAAVLLVLAPGISRADVVTGTITDPTGNFAVGISYFGELFDPNSGTGFIRLADSYDPLLPGTPRDSWGISGAVSGSAYADYTNYGDVNVTSVNTYGANSAVVSAVVPGYTVYMNYVFGAANVLEIQTTITNTSGVAQDTLFQRDVDWDVYPTEFNENSFANPVSGNVIDSSYDGFESPDPSQPYYSSCFSGCNQTGDLGGGIKLDLGVLAPNQTSSFTFYYGISQTGEDVNGLISQVQGLGATYYVGTQSSENGGYPNLGANSAIIAVGSSTPEPATFGLLAAGIGLLGALARRRKKA